MPYALGTCRGCGTPVDGCRCESCKADRRQQEAARRARLKCAGLCLVCAAPVARTKLLNAGRKRVRAAAAYCKTHLAYYAQRTAQRSA
jgi:hypothetical protein